MPTTVTVDGNNNASNLVLESTSGQINETDKNNVEVLEQLAKNAAANSSENAAVLNALTDNALANVLENGAILEAISALSTKVDSGLVSAHIRVQSGLYSAKQMGGTDIYEKPVTYALDLIKELQMVVNLYYRLFI